MKRTLETRYFVRASHLYDPATGSTVAFPSFLAPPPVEATDAEVRAAVTEAGL